VRAIVYSRTGDPDVLTLVDRPIPEVAADEVRVRLHVAGGTEVVFDREAAD